MGEDLTLVVGGWLIYRDVSGRHDGSIRLARIVFGLALVPIGLSHFFYLQAAANFTPAWMPLHVPLGESPDLDRGDGDGDGDGGGGGVGGGGILHEARK